MNMLSSSSLSADAGTLVRENLYINGMWLDGEAAPVDVHDPSSGELLATVASASAQQVEQAAPEARAALTGWAQPAQRVRGERSRPLRRAPRRPQGLGLPPGKVLIRRCQDRPCSLLKLGNSR